MYISISSIVGFQKRTMRREKMEALKVTNIVITISQISDDFGYYTNKANEENFIDAYIYYT